MQEIAVTAAEHGGRVALRRRVTAGNGNQPSSEERFLLVETPSITDGSQSPCSSIAALPLRDQARRAAGALLGRGAEEAGLERVGLHEAVRSVLAWVKQESLRLTRGHGGL